MSYNINRANGTNFLVLNDNVINREYSVTFVGKMVPNYGQAINTNFLRLLENSASSSQPAKPVVGQLWYDSNLKKLKFYNGTSFYTLDSIPPNTTGTTVYLSSNAQGDFIWVTGNSIIGDVIVNLNNISGTTVIDRSRGNIFKAVATGNFLLSPRNIIAGQSFTLIVTQDATGSRKATYPRSFYFAMGFKELSTDPGSIDMINVFYDGTIFYATLTIEYVSAVSSTIITTTTTSAPIAITTTTTTTAAPTTPAPTTPAPAVTTTTTPAPAVTTTTTAAPVVTTTTTAAPSSSVTLTINDAAIIGGSGGTYQWGYTFVSGLGSLNPNTSFLWEGTITGLYSFQPESGFISGTFIDFSESQFYTGPYYITYRGQKYTFISMSRNDSYGWFNPDDNIFGGYGLGTVVISTQ
jgi:hypothetical protein